MEGTDKTKEFQFVKGTDEDSTNKTQGEVTEVNTPKLATEKEVEEYKQIKQYDTNNKFEVPKASDLGKYKDPRLMEFEGTEKFEQSLTHNHEFEKNVVTSKAIDDLTNLIGHTNKELNMKYRREHKYELTDTQENLYKEVVFETSKIKMRETIRKPFNPLRKQHSQKVRNWDKMNSFGIENAPLPKHNRLEAKVVNNFETIIDPYKYLESPSEAQAKVFESQEEMYRHMIAARIIYPHYPRKGVYKP